MNKPVIDYANLPHLPREGIQTAGNNAWSTRSLFLETALPQHETTALWCLSEHEVFAHGRWYPSAWMAYIHATDEYDALRKICGNVKQWEHIKSFLAKHRPNHLDMWQTEQAYIQRSKIKDRLLKEVMAGGSGYTSAARIVLQMLEGQGKPGRPKKEKEKVKDSGVAEDAARILTFAK